MKAAAKAEAAEETREAKLLAKEEAKEAKAVLKAAADENKAILKAEAAEEAREAKLLAKEEAKEAKAVLKAAADEAKAILKAEAAEAKTADKETAKAVAKELKDTKLASDKKNANEAYEADILAIQISAKVAKENVAKLAAEKKNADENEAALLEKVYCRALAEAAKLEYKLNAKLTAKTYSDEALKDKKRMAEKLKAFRQAGLIWVQEMQNIEWSSQEMQNIEWSSRPQT